MKTLSIGALALSLAALPQLAAAQTTYSSRATFTGAAGALATETFTGCGTATTGFSGNLSSSSGPCTGILPGVTYSAPAGSLYIAAPNQSTNPTTALGLNTPAGGALVVTFATAQSAFGTDLFRNSGGGFQDGAGAYNLAFLLNGGSVGSFNVTAAANGGSFFGLTGAGFNEVRISQAAGFSIIDNVSFGSGVVAGVPEPATWGMMLMGFGGLGYVMRRRRPAGARIRFA